MGDYLIGMAKISTLVTDIILSLMVAVCTACITIGVVHFKSAKDIHARLAYGFTIISGMVFIGAIFWYFIIFITLKGVVE